MAISDEEDEKKSELTASGRARRRFLHDTALATAGSCAAALLPAMGCAMPRAAAEASPGASPSDCPDVKMPMKEVAGKVAFITGGSSGIGLGMARAFADAGMKVAIGYRTKAHLEEAMTYLETAGDRVHAIRVDVNDRPGMERAAAETVQVFGKVHVVVNNAGVQNPAALSRTTYEEWDRLMGVNLTGVFNGVRAFLPHIKEHGEGGQVVATASILGLFTIGGGYGAYCASKFAVVSLMETLRAELAESNIGVSVCCPGVVKSNLEESLKRAPLATDPFELGQLVLRGMRRNDLYILTHPEFEPVIQARHEALMASSPTDEHPSDARVAVARSVLDNSVYVAERDRQRCARAGRGNVTM